MTFKGTDYYVNMNDWIGNDHSPVRPADLSRSDMRKLRINSLNPDVMKDPSDAANAELVKALNSLRGKIPASVDEAEVIRRARRVRGKPPVKVAVALYSIKAFTEEELVSHLGSLGIKISAFDLYSLTYRSGLKKVRLAIGFNEISRRHPVITWVLQSCGLSSRAGRLYEEHYRRIQDSSQGSRPSTIAERAFSEALNELGLRPI
ncbi:MAG: hypothetical protein JRM84_07725 [Nitrososphaerota archaeon]|jgi:hypothetical protein|nr:hypothetical protein [Nitrososphaerota archaeon]MDG6944881.1 hypothetical protein [Nitrososphaerota archaeon]